MDKDKGSGRVRQRGDTFTAYWWVKDPATGAWKQRTSGGHKTERLARKHLNEQLGEVAKGTWREAKDKHLTVGAFLTEYWLPAARHQAVGADGEPRRESTTSWYETVVDKWLIPHIGGQRLSALTPVDVERGLARLREHGGRNGKPLSGRSVQGAHGVLRTALEYGTHMGYVTSNPAAALRRQGSKASVPEPWTVDEVREFLTKVRADRLYAAWLLLLSRGLRRGELAGLRWSSIDLDKGTLKVEHTLVEINGRRSESVPKTQAGFRQIALDPDLVAAMREHRRTQVTERLAWGPAWSDSGLVFVREDGGGFLPSSLSQRFERLCKANDVRRIRLHDTRHTAASLMLAAGVPVKVVSEMLGHSDPRITLAIYTHTTEAQHREAGAAYTAALVGGQP